MTGRDLILELLNLALESNVTAGPLGGRGVPGGDEEWERRMREHRRKSKATGQTAQPQAQGQATMGA